MKKSGEAPQVKISFIAIVRQLIKTTEETKVRKNMGIKGGMGVLLYAVDRLVASINVYSGSGVFAYFLRQ